MLCLSQILNVPERNLLVPWNGHFWNVTSIKQTRDAKFLNFATMTNSLSISYGMESVTCPLTDQIAIFLCVFTVIFTWQQSIFICCHMHTLIIIIIAMTTFMVLSSWPVIARVHLVHLTNVDWMPGGRQPSDQASQLGLWVRGKLAAIIHVHHRHCYYYSARRLILILPSHEGRKAEST